MLRFAGLLAALMASAAIPLRADAWSEALDKLRTGDQAGAIQILQLSLAKDPAAVRPNVLLTEVLLGAQRVAEARTVSDHALTSGPAVAEFHRIAGDVLFRQGYIGEAEKQYKDAARLDSKNARALMGIARVYQTASVNQKALQLLRAAHNLDTDDPAIEAELASVEGYSPEAVARWRQALAAMDPGPAGAPAPGNESSSTRELRAHIAEAEKLAGKTPNELSSAYTHYQMPLLVERDGQREFGLGVAIAVNGVKGNLQLDSGATGILISSKMAERAGVQRLAAVDLGGIGNKGPVKGWLGYADEIQIGGLTLRNCIVRVPEKGSVSEAGGLLGTDVFRRFLIKLNFLQRRMELDPLPGPAWDGQAQVDHYAGPELKDWAQFLRLGHYLLLQTHISDGPPVLFLVDTGSSFNMISATVAPSVTKLRADPRKHVKGISGEVNTVYTADEVTLTFANYRQVSQDLTAFDLSNFSRSGGAEITGIMGLPLLGLFNSLTIDYRDGRIKFTR